MNCNLKGRPTRTPVKLEQAKMAKKIYKGGTTSKTTTRADANHVSHGRKQNLGEAASPTNTKKGQTGKRNTNMQAI